MGRSGCVDGAMMIDEARRTSFDRAAAQYDAARPSYPDALVAAAVAGLAPNARLLEIGAGTGKATVPFARRGLSLLALEPGANMAAVLRANVASLPNVTVDVTTFEGWTPTGSFDLVYSAQAIHWIDPAVRYVKIAAALRPGGMLAVIRNEKAALDPELRADLDVAYARWFPSSDEPLATVDSVRHDYVTEIAASARFGAVEVATFPWTTHYSAAQYVALLDTYSEHALLPAENRAGLYAAISDVIDRHGGVAMPYVAMLFLARVR